MISSPEVRRTSGYEQGEEQMANGARSPLDSKDASEMGARTIMMNVMPGIDDSINLTLKKQHYDAIELTQDGVCGRAHPNGKKPTVADFCSPAHDLQEPLSLTPNDFDKKRVDGLYTYLQKQE